MVRHSWHFPEAHHYLPSALTCREELQPHPSKVLHASTKAHLGRMCPHILGSRQLNQGESSTAQELYPVLGEESQTEENISIKIALALCLTWPP